MYFTSDGVTGGARQLAQVLQNRAKRGQPERFARLSLRVPGGRAPRLSGEDARWLERCRSRKRPQAPGLPQGVRRIARILWSSRSRMSSGASKTRCPSDAIEMLHWLATEHDDPATELLAGTDAPGGGPDVLQTAISIRPASIPHVEELPSLFGTSSSATPLYVERFHAQPSFEWSAIRSASVLSCVAGTLARSCLPRFCTCDAALPKHESVRGASTRDTPRLRIHTSTDFETSFAELRPIVKRMLRSSESEVCEVGARLASLALLTDQSAADLVDVKHYMAAPIDRLGVAQVASANIGTPECRRWSEETLVTCYSTTRMSDVRGEAASCFRQLNR